MLIKELGLRHFVLIIYALILEELLPLQFLISQIKFLFFVDNFPKDLGIENILTTKQF